MTLKEIKTILERYKTPVYRGNPTACNYVEAVESLLFALNQAHERALLAEEFIEETNLNNPIIS
jgi:hypothetical protein